MKHKIQQRHGTRSRAGVSLTEVVVATALLLISIVPILRALTVSQASSRVIEQKSRSLTLAQAGLDEIRAQCIHDFPPHSQGSRRVIDSYYDMVTAVDDASNPDLEIVTVSVGYDDNENGQLGSDEVLVTLTSAVARRD